MLLKPVINGQYRTEMQTLFSEYIGWVVAEANQGWGLNLDAQEIVEADIATLDRLLPPNGGFYLAHMNGELAGMGGLKQLDEKTGEIKRMYVRSQMRGQGIGKLILDQLIADARTLGYDKIYLDSPIFSDKAQRLYQSRGFRYIDPYPGNENPEELYYLLKFMRLDL